MITLEKNIKSLLSSIYIHFTFSLLFKIIVLLISYFKTDLTDENKLRVVTY